MRHQYLQGLVLVALAVLSLSLPRVAQAQELAVPQISEEKLALYATTSAKIADIRDEFHAEFARTSNKTNEFQTELRRKQREEITKVMEESGLTQAEYDQITWVISVDPKQRDALAAVVERQKNAPR